MALFGTVASVSALRISRTLLEARFYRFCGCMLKQPLILRCVVLEHTLNAGCLAGLFRVFGSNTPHKRKQTRPKLPKETRLTLVSATRGSEQVL